MRTVVFAYHALGHAGLQALLRHGYDIALVLSHADDPDEDCWWPSVAELCGRQNIPLLLDADLADAALRQRIIDLAPDVIFSFYFRHMIPMGLLDVAAVGAFNLHGSLLPRYRGRCPVNWQLVHGEEETGLTLHRMVARPDAGAIVAQEACAIGPDQTAHDVYRQLLDLAPGLLDEALPAIAAGRHQEREQDHSQASYFGGRRPADGAIDWNWSARRIHNLIRAVAKPYPGAFCSGPKGERILIWRSDVLAEQGTDQPPGSVDADGAVCCGDGKLRIIEAEGPAGPYMPAPGSRLFAAHKEHS